jgi:LysR family transcriptional regulator, glycine cleavage system transcriptional activator
MGLALLGVSSLSLTPRPQGRGFFLRPPPLDNAALRHDLGGMRRLPPLGALEAFVVVAQRRGLRAAAADLNLSPSALSRRVQSLESHLGKRVFDRASGEFRLTEAGEGLFADIVPAFDLLNRALDGAREEGTETLRLGVMPAFAHAWLLPRLARFRARYPAIEVDLDTSPDPMARLATGVDAAIFLAEGPEPGLYSRCLCQQQVLAVCAPELLRRGPPLHGPADLQHHTLLMHRRLPQMVSVWLDRVGAGVEPKRVEYYDSGPLLLEAATLGMGVAVVFDTMVTAHLKDGRLIQALPQRVESPLNYWFFCREPAMATRAVRRFHDWLVEEAAASRPGVV